MRELGNDLPSSLGSLTYQIPLTTSYTSGALSLMTRCLQKWIRRVSLSQSYWKRPMVCEVLLFSHVLPSPHPKTLPYHHPHLPLSHLIGPPLVISAVLIVALLRQTIRHYQTLKLSHGIVLLGTSLGRLPEKIDGVVGWRVAVAGNSDVSL